jgi:hypothetical protein
MRGRTRTDEWRHPDPSRSFQILGAHQEPRILALSCKGLKGHLSGAHARQDILIASSCSHTCPIGPGSCPRYCTSKVHLLPQAKACSPDVAWLGVALPCPVQRPHQVRHKGLHLRCGDRSCPYQRKDSWDKGYGWVAVGPYGPPWAVAHWRAPWVVETTLGWNWTWTWVLIQIPAAPLPPSVTLNKLFNLCGLSFPIRPRG